MRALRQKNAENECVNKITLRGTIIRKFRKDDKWLVLTLLCTSTNSGDARKDTPSIYWYGEDIDMVDKAYVKGDHVTVDATLVTNKRYKSETIVGIDINDTPRELDTKFGPENGGRFVADLNEVCLKGTLLHTFEPESSGGRLSIATVKVVIDGKAVFPQISFFGRQLAKLRTMEPGATMCILGHIQTRVQHKGDESIYRQSIVCHYVKETNNT